jgi:hypothetical protein
MWRITTVKDLHMGKSDQISNEVIIQLLNKINLKYIWLYLKIST